MKSFIGQMAGGIVVILAASIIGITYNAVRSNGVKLIQDVTPVSTARGHGTDASTSSPADASGVLPEGAIGLEEMKRMVDESSVAIIDARASDAFASGHIPGAVNIPYDKLIDYVDELELAATPEEMVILYCWSPTCDFADQLSTELRILGYNNTRIFTGGWNQWVEAGYPGETQEDEE